MANRNPRRAAPADGQPPSAEVPDWARESKSLLEWSPSRSLLASIRAYQRHKKSRLPWNILACKAAVLRHRLWSIVTGADIPLNTTISGGLLLPHPNGIVIHPDAHIGPNCIIFQQVTLAAGGAAAPRLGGNVQLGAGAKLLGDICIGDHASVGANAVVLQDIPAGATAVGVPARIV